MARRPSRLSEPEIAQALTQVPEWARNGEEIQRAVTAPTFLAGIELVDEVARAAEEADHHPDIDIRWRTVSFTLSTHSAGGLTVLDFQLAARIDQLTAELPPDGDTA